MDKSEWNEMLPASQFLPCFLILEKDCNILNDWLKAIGFYLPKRMSAQDWHISRTRNGWKTPYTWPRWQVRPAHTFANGSTYTGEWLGLGRQVSSCTALIAWDAVATHCFAEWLIWHVVRWTHYLYGTSRKCFVRGFWAMESTSFL